jgi:gamma-glutamyltranspeptidase/glutathione hydrolase
VTEFGMSLPEAIQGKRFHHQWKPNQISAEEGCFTEEVQAKLEKMGHKINYRDPIGRVEGIIRLPDGKWQGVADQRGDDAAAGY